MMGSEKLKIVFFIFKDINTRSCERGSLLKSMVLREVLKTEGIAQGFQPSRVTLQMLMNDKIMFDLYYCIYSTKHCENEENISTLYFITSSHFFLCDNAMHDSGPGQVLMI